MKTCSHCQISYKNDVLKKVIHEEKELYFCCNGCENAYFLLHQNHLESFYHKLSNQTITPPNPQSQEKLQYFDTPSFLQKYVYQTSKNLSQFSLILEGIHCSACTWLIENTLKQQKGIFEASINYTNNKIQITFNLTQIKPSEIIALIQQIGYNASVYDPNLSEQHHKQQNKKYYIAMIIAIFCTMNIMWIAIAQYAGYFSDISKPMKNALNFASFLLSTPVLFWTGRFFYFNAFYQLKNKMIGMDLLVITGATLTYCYSIYAAITQSGETYFEAVSMIITFVFIGKFLEIKAKKDAGDNLDKLSFLLPAQVHIIKDNKKVAITPQEVKLGDIIEIAPNEVIAIDGTLISQEALLDTQNISGESLPILKNKGDEILSGSINTQNTFRYEAKKIFADSLLFKLIDILEHSLAQKPQIQNLANMLSQYFSRAVLLIALFGFLLWFFFFKSSFEYALMIAISVIVISCPCALALATPIASIIGISEAYKQKIIFKESRFLEIIAKATHLFLDKTGTLTLGIPQVKDIKIFEDFDRKTLLALLSYSKHPIAQGIRDFYPRTTHTPLQRVQEILGKGIIGYDDDVELLGGSLAFLQTMGVDTKSFDLNNFIGFGFARDKKLCSIFLLEDTIKKEAQDIIKQIYSKISNIILLSGDHQKSVAYVAQALQIKDYHHSLLPQQKAKLIKEYQANGAISIMVGDGINDTLALNQSDIGIAFDTQNGATSITSDVIMLDQSLSSLNNVLKISHQTYKIIKQNITISIIYNVLMIPIALCGFVIPLFAAISMSLSSLIVIGNSLRIKKYK